MSLDKHIVDGGLGAASSYSAALAGPSGNDAMGFIGQVVVPIIVGVIVPVVKDFLLERIARFKEKRAERKEKKRSSV